ncbi:MAG TPA: PSD1 and planctomycete cytochrome C domain-containing protein [Verrucomicrobiota bacterium]|nr:PSD1 and planctomycete cytochrome C domain-containing protein [Verrucomicrobiota bacterium]
MRLPSTWPTLPFLIALGTASASLAVATTSSETDFFEQRIRPALSEHCFECHGAEKQKGGLRLDSRAQLLKGGDSGPAVVPGQPDESLLYQAITHRHADSAMPPKKPKLPEPVIVDFARWIREGAAWPAEAATAPAKEAFDLATRVARSPWMWRTPERQTVPQVKGPEPASDVDAFVRAKLEEKGLSPALATDDSTWLRRVNFVITGLPPTREALHAFLNDRSPDRRERVVDRLLASPHFGERWARHWMDLIRYAESRGHEGDYLIANAWHYRDYLIRAFNEDVPYDQFLREHLAGDLLLRPRLRQGTDINESVLATGWAFLGEENHSPVDIRQDECERIDNKIDVFSKTFLGLTVSCARCHDHKFDPIRAQDYYALTGFMLGSSFRQVRFEAMENNRKMAAELRNLREKFTPRLAELVAASQQESLGHIASYLLAAREALQSEATNGTALPQSTPRADSLDPQRLQLWVDHLHQAVTNQANPLHQFALNACRSRHKEALASAGVYGQSLVTSSPTGKPLSLPADARVIADYSQPAQQPWKVDGEAFGTRPLDRGDLILGDNATNPIVRVMPYGAARRDLFWNRLKTASDNENDSGKLAATARAGQMLRTPTVTLGVGKLHYLIKGKTRVYAAVDSHLMVEGPLHGVLVQTFDSGPTDQPKWFTHDLSAYSGHRTHVEFGPEGEGELEVLMVVESAEAPKWQPTAVFEPSASVSSWTDYANEFAHAAVAANEQLGRMSLANPTNATTTATLANWLVQNPKLFGKSSDPVLRQVADAFVADQTEIASRVRWESHTAVAWFDGTGVDENVLVRGKPFKPGAVSPRSLPAAFASTKPITTTATSGRDELAQQLVDPGNPLVARVIVNRVWHHLFGRGLVATVDNFGALGERPTHPELLDQLAWQFVHEDGWSLKRLIKRVVLTDTFAMSSHLADARTEELDPTNALLHRRSVRRLEGEAIRDSLLAVSGRLNPTLYGPPITVYLTEFTVGRGRPEKSGPLDGDGRRSVYSAMRRNFLPTFIQTFDAPTPFSTVGKRNVSNVPAQSLALMNDPLFHQQARVWAERLLSELPTADVPTRVRWLIESAYGRAPTETEAAACLESLAELRPLSNAEDNSVEVWAELCHALLNASDFIYVK